MYKNKVETCPHYFQKSLQEVIYHSLWKLLTKEIYRHYNQESVMYMYIYMIFFFLDFFNLGGK